MQTLIPLPLSADKKTELVGYLSRKFYEVTQARTNQVDSKYTRWMANYAGQPKEAVRTTPWPNASNFMPQLIRMHTDILAARVIGVVCGTKPFWKPRTFIAGPHDWLESLSAWMEYMSFYQMGLYEPIDKAISRGFKCGTIFLKAPWVENTTYLGQPGSTPGESFKEVAYRTEGVDVKPIPFDDFYPYPITADSYDQIQIKFHKLRMTKEMVEYRIAAGMWDKTAAEKIMQGDGRDIGPAREKQAMDAGVDLEPEVIQPFKCVEAWLDYPITNDPTKLFKIVVVFNPLLENKDGFLRGYFNPSSVALDPFVQFTPMPRDDLFCGYSVPEVLEGAQEELAQIHNWRRDANTIANTPGWVKKRGANVPNPSSSWYPGKTFEVDEMDDLKQLEFGRNYNSMMEEEGFLIQQVERQIGSGPAQQGQGAGSLDGKRGIYTSQGTMALLSEGNKRLDIYIKRYRFPFNRLGNLIYYSNKDWRPDGQEFITYGEAGANVVRTFKFKEPEGYRGLFFEIGASEASANKEIDRSNLLLMANTMAGYYRQVTEAAGIITQLSDGNPMREILVQVLDGARDLAKRILFVFDVDDRNRLLPDVRSLLAGGIQQAADAAQQSGLPVSEEPLGIGDLQGLGQRLAAVASSGSSAPGTGIH